MEVDSDIGRWILEFLSRQPIPPLTGDNISLKKPILLRQLESEVSKESVPETVLDLILQIAELDGITQHSDSIKAAYLAVAVECTVRFLGNSERDSRFEYFEAVKRIWKGKDSKLGKAEGTGLISEVLRGWKDDIEAAVWEDSACDVVLKKSQGIDAAQVVRAYVDEQKGKMGPSILQSLAEALEALNLGQARDNQSHGKREVHKDGLSRRKQIAPKPSKGVPAGAEIIDVGSSDGDEPNERCDSPVTCYLTRLVEALESSPAAVEDHLPDSSHKAEKATSDMTRNISNESLEEGNTRADPPIAQGSQVPQEEERLEKEQAELMPLLTGGKLRTYQIKGVKWLISLWKKGSNGILADEMGLGKTIQTIAFLAHLKGIGLDGPYLVVAPATTLSNWLYEINRLVPSVKAVIYHGEKKNKMEIRRELTHLAIGPEFPIVITSYDAVCKGARTHFEQFNWEYLVVDECHNLNSRCKLVKKLRCLRVKNKLLLTGTPLRNNLAELWTLLNFIRPDIYSSLEEFESWFDLSGECNNEAMKEELEEKRRAQVLAKLHLILSPLMLRRLKSEVEKTLPRKKEIILYATMTRHQKKLQDEKVTKTLEVAHTKATRSGSYSSIAGQLGILRDQLLKICGHPILFESASNTEFPPIEEIVQQCGKFRLLDRLLSKLFARQHKVLVFSQWTKILDIMGYYFSGKGFDVCRIDAEVADRGQQELNDVKSNVVFLLSTKATWPGINLTAADTCIFYDSDWNPHMELQAVDKCHRTGQTKPVHVYWLATAQSFECQVLKEAFSKLLELVVIGKGKFRQVITKQTSLDDVIEQEDIQTDISDEDLDRVLDRTDLVGVANEAETTLLPLKGPGWEVVPIATGGFLPSITT